MGRFGVAGKWLSGRRTDVFVLTGVGVVAAACWAFLAAADAVTGQADARVLRSLRKPNDPADPLGPRWLEEAARDVTALGGQAVLTLLVGSVLGYLVIARRRHAAVFVLVATVGGALISTALKGMYSRPRPDVVPHLAYVTSHSFPSGHAMLSAVVYLTLGALLARLVEGRWAKLYFVGVAILLTLLVGLSRVYLGVHYPTDVVAGWAAGVAWAVLCWLAARRLQRRGVVEGPVK
jgi:undecaprenyl-diphosphatase